MEVDKGEDKTFCIKKLKTGRSVSKQSKEQWERQYYEIEIFREDFKTFKSIFYP